MHRFFTLLFAGFASSAFSQSIGTFNSVQPNTQTQNLVLPTTHTFQRIVRSGATLSSGETVGNNLDFTGYVPIGGSSTNGYLSLSNETFPAGVSILNISYNASTKLWAVNSGANVPFPLTDLGYVSAFCAGTVAPNGHVFVCEETASLSDMGNTDGYNDDGWIIEIDPVTRRVINQDGVGGVDKLWPMGRQKHEDIVIKADQSVAYWSADNDVYGYVYKFVPAVPGNFSTGSLYVLKSTAALGTGTWEPVANTTQSDRNNTVALSSAAGGYNFSRVEGIELGPDGKIYFAATTSGRVYRFRDLGNSVDQLEVFVESTNYDVDGAGPFSPTPWGNGADNLAFDGEGNLWVLQDGGNNYIWVVGANHTAATPNVRLFGIVPAGAEPTGITFSPDYKFLFMSVQHPNSNTASQTDAAGTAVVFDQSTAIVIARKENLGTVALPISLLSFEAKQNGSGVELNWKTPVAVNDAFDVERSADGGPFETIGTLRQNASSFVFVDNNFPVAKTLHYRLKQRNFSGKTVYSETRALRLQKAPLLFRYYPSPATTKLHLDFTSTTVPLNVSVLNAAGIVVKRRTNVTTGSCDVHLQGLPAGSYRVLVVAGKERSIASFIKQ